MLLVYKIINHSSNRKNLLSQIISTIDFDLDFDELLVGSDFLNEFQIEFDTSIENDLNEDENKQLKNLMNEFTINKKIKIDFQTIFTKDYCNTLVNNEF